jgi:excisionase family DNA binding protein
MDRTNGEPPDGQSLTLTIPQVARLLGVSVNKAYEAARRGDLPTIRVGVRVLVSRRRPEELVDRRYDGTEPPEEQAAARR